MFENLFRGLFDSGLVSVISVSEFLLCLFTALLLGLVIAFTYMHQANYTKSFVTTLALLPAVVCIVIMMVNGNVGAGVAVAGAFSLVRFRSVPGTAKEICMLFLAMGCGLISGMGYLAFAALFTIIMCVMVLIYNYTGFGDNKEQLSAKVLNITIPESLDYTNIFDDIFKEYCEKYDIVRVKTTNMGSMFKVTINVWLYNNSLEKEMIDKIRCRNGNLEITISRQDMGQPEL